MVERRRPTLDHEITCNNLDVFNVRWNFTGDQLALGTSNGYVQLYNSSFEQVRNLNCQSGAEKMPITSVRFRPELVDTSRKPVLLATTCDGGVVHWNLANGKSLSTIRLRNEQIYSADFNSDGTNYILGCKEGKIKLFDEANFTQIGEFSHSMQGEAEGAQRVFCLKWFSENLFLSAGWDNKITIWDVRTTKYVREIIGPHVCGDSVDVRDNYLISGSYHIREQLQVWSLESGANIHTLTMEFGGKKCMPYSVQFCRNEGLTFAVGGVGSGEIYFYQADTLQQVAVIPDAVKTVYSMHLGNNNRFAVGIGNSSRIYTT